MRGTQGSLVAKACNTRGKKASCSSLVPKVPYSSCKAKKAFLLASYLRKQS